MVSLPEELAICSRSYIDSLCTVFDLDVCAFTHRIHIVTLVITGMNQPLYMHRITKPNANIKRNSNSVQCRNSDGGSLRQHYSEYSHDTSCGMHTLQGTQWHFAQHKQHSTVLYSIARKVSLTSRGRGHHSPKIVQSHTLHPNQILRHQKRHSVNCSTANRAIPL